jgi:hypothetical protein
MSIEKRKIFFFFSPKYTHAIALCYMFIQKRKIYLLFNFLRNITHTMALWYMSIQKHF